MGRFVSRVQALALALGGVGLFLTSFMDALFLPPEVNDLLLVWMVTQHKSRMLYYAASATLGSTAGCLLLYYIGRRADGWVKRRFSAARVAKAMQTLQRYGVLAVLIPSLLPPPAPFKIFVLMSGVAGISPARFTMAILIGRGLRYFGLGTLSLYYGDQAVDFLRDNGRTLSLGLIGLIAIGSLAYLAVKRIRQQRTTVN